MKIKFFILAIVTILGLTVGVYFLRPHTFHGTVIQSPEPSHDFTLKSFNGDVSLRDFRGKVVLLYFGYTFCPDICPGTLGNVAQALRDMGTKAEDVQLIMVSLDPERDTPEKLADYMNHFHPSFIGITGTKEQLDEIASLYGIYYQKSEGSNATGYLIDHTATLLVLDREGYLKLVFPYGVTAQDIADDLKYMLRQ
ncbi:MAG: SCO family protein [Anaerolineales bacterium]